MRALSIATFGDVDVLEISDVPVPTPGPGQVQVRVAAAAVHPADLFTRAGMFAGVVAGSDRYYLGWDFAGQVSRTGPDVVRFAVGEAVVGMSDWLVSLVGTQAEYVVVNADTLARAPRGVGAVNAAALPVNGLTAAQALDLLDVPAGSTLAIIGAAGAVGTFALELAVHRGVRVIGVAGPHDEHAITARGARFAGRTSDLAGSLAALAPAGVDALLDTAVVGTPALAAIRDGGRYVGVIAPYAPSPERGVQVHTVGVHSDGQQLARLVDLVENGVITLRVAAQYDLADAAHAHNHLAKGGVRGAIVLRP